jgi:Ca-activated chloride channel family protein
MGCKVRARWFSTCGGVGALRTALLAVSALIFFVASSAGFAQTGIQEVHITPRTRSVAEPGQEPGSSLKTYTKPLKANVDLVLVPVTITDAMNRLVLGLDKGNFQVYENKELQAIQHFSSQDAPISLGVIFDTSASMASKIVRARQAVVEFLRTANPQDEFSMITFADKPTQIAEFTTSVEDIQNRLVYARPKGSTALLDAIYMGVSKMREAKYTRKALLIISDGGDNHSRYTEREVKDVVKEGDVMIYAIGVYDHYFASEEERLGPQLLSDITRVTGGRSFTIDNPNDLADVAAEIGVELRNQYVLGYRPNRQNHDGKWHKVRVKLMPPKGLPRLNTYAREGYYAPSE